MKFSQKTKLKQTLFADSEKEVGNFLKTGTILKYPVSKKCPRSTLGSIIIKIAHFPVKSLINFDLPKFLN